MTETGQSHSSDSTESRHAVKRRGLIAGAAALVAGIVAKQAAQPVAAAPFSADNFTANGTATNYAATGTATTAFSTSGGTFTYGLYAAGSSQGVRGAAGSGGVGVAGTASGQGSWGVSGGTDDGYGVYGKASNNGYGVWGEASNLTAVVGISKGDGNGVSGISTNGIGVYGVVPSGSASGTLAISGSNNATAANSHGIVGTAGSGHGLIGNTNYTPPAGGGAPFYAGLVGNAPNGAYAGLFFGKVSITGTLNGHTAIMQHANLAVAHPDGTHRLANSVGAVESWLEDIGKGTLTNGQTNIKIDPAFAALADMGDYHVFLERIS